MKMEKSKYNSLSEWKKADTKAYRAAIQKGLIDDICTLFGWENKEEKDIWNEFYNCLLIFIKDNEYIPNKNKIINGFKIGYWCFCQRKKFKKGNLSTEKISLLNKIEGWYWEKEEDWQWYKNYKLLIEYIKEHNTIPKSKDNKWCDSQRQKFKKGNLSTEKITLLNKIEGWYWEKNLDDVWEDRYKTLLDFIKENKRLPTQEEVLNEFKIGIWCASQKQNFKKNKLSTEKISLLNKIEGWNWGIYFEDVWINNYRMLLNFVKENESLPTQAHKIDGVRIGAWCSAQKQNFKNGKLSTEKITLLSEVKGWDLGKNVEDNWYVNYNLLLKFVKENNSIPSQTKEIDGVRIGAWCSRQRNNPNLSNERVELLNKVNGWLWNYFDITD